MEYFGTNGFSEELLALRSGDPLEAMLPMAISEMYNNGWNYDFSTFGGNPIIPTPKTVPFEDYYSLQIDPQSLINSSFSEFLTPFDGALTSPPELTDNSSNTMICTSSPPFIPSQEDYNSFSSIVGNEDQEILANALQNLENNIMQVGQCKVEEMEALGVMQSSSAEGVVPNTFNVGISSSSDRSNKSKKLNGQPSKNLMAERRRRKRLNDRLSMLRSVAPKISKMDRTSILGDTIDYMKELLERINMMQQELDQEGSNHQLPTLMNVFKHVKSNEVLVRNSPKFDVERRNMDTRIEICCAGKPGLLLSTVTTMEALGLEIEQCVISCFSDFSMQASCSEVQSILNTVHSTYNTIISLFLFFHPHFPPFRFCVVVTGRVF